MTAARILVVDDDPWIQRMVSTILSKRGHSVETAADGEEAVRKVAAQRPDLIITDVMMPRMDGWSFVRAIRSQPELALVPVIFLTAISLENDKIRGFRLGADDYLAKPFRFEELEARVAKALARRTEISDVQAQVRDSSQLISLRDMEPPARGAPPPPPVAAAPPAAAPPPVAAAPPAAAPPPQAAPLPALKEFVFPSSDGMSTVTDALAIEPLAALGPGASSAALDFSSLAPGAAPPPMPAGAVTPAVSPLAPAGTTPDAAAPVVADEDPAQFRSALHGGLDHIGLSSLLVMLEMERKSGMLVLHKDGRVGRIFLRKGRVIRAQTEGPESCADAAAVYQLLTWADGRFDFVRMEVEGDDVVKSSTTHLLMEGARLIDEMNKE